MKQLFAAALYLALAITAIPLQAGDLEYAASLRDGDMKKLIFHPQPEAVSKAAFEVEGGTATLADYKGKWLLVNFWATWCAPCRHEMPMLSELQSDFGGDRFEVVTIATGRNPPKSIAKFFVETGITNLPHHRDPRQSLASQMGVFGLPITVLIDPEGREVARLRGDADWSSSSAKAIIASLVRGAS